MVTTNERVTTNKRTGGQSRERLVQATATKLREMILAREPDTQIGSLREIAKTLGVGIVTVQQVARVLEHEGFLEVRRGHDGGYYGARPNEAALQRSISGYLLVHRSSSKYHEAIDVVTLLDCELMATAALCTNESLREQLRILSESIDSRGTSELRVAFENEMHDVLFRMVNRPLMELLARVAMRHYTDHPHTTLYVGEEGVVRWRTQRHEIVRAILRRDPELARFEAARRRTDLLSRLKTGLDGTPSE
jgi:DNA-binding FadR family transcriptional regulator